MNSEQRIDEVFDFINKFDVLELENMLNTIRKSCDEAFKEISKPFDDNFAESINKHNNISATENLIGYVELVAQYHELSEKANLIEMLYRYKKGIPIFYRPGSNAVYDNINQDILCIKNLEVAQ